MVLPKFDLRDFKLLPNVNDCVCGSDDIVIAEEFTLGVLSYTTIKCNKCNREIKRRTYKKAAKVWNRNNPKGGAE